MKRFLFPLLLLAACGPVPLAQAEKECLSRAHDAEGPHGKVFVGIDNEGNVGGGMEIGVTSDYVQGRDPAQVYDSCVYQRSGGQMPSRPYSSYPRQ